MQQLVREGKRFAESINNAGWRETLAGPRLSRWTLLPYLSICLCLPGLLPSRQHLPVYLLHIHTDLCPTVALAAVVRILELQPLGRLLCMLLLIQYSDVVVLSVLYSKHYGCAAPSWLKKKKIKGFLQSNNVFFFFYFKINCANKTKRKMSKPGQYDWMQRCQEEPTAVTTAAAPPGMPAE